MVIFRTDQPGQVLSIFLALLGSAVIIVLSLMAYYLTGDRYSARTALSLRAGDLSLIAGQGDIKAGGFEIRQVSSKGIALISSAPINIPADRYTRLQWRIEGLRPQVDARFAWTTKEAPTILREMPLKFSGKSTGYISLDSLPNWQGSIAGIGLIVYGKLDQPIVLRRLRLIQPSPGIGVLLIQLWHEWTTLEYWSQRSINFISGTSQHDLLPPVPAAAAWAGLSALLYGGLLLIRRQPWTVMPLLAFFFVGWLLLDARWQWNLWHQAGLTRERYANKNWEEKRLAAEDGQLFQFIREVRKKMPANPVRVYLMSADPEDKTRYMRSRAQFHLLPHNVNSSLSDLPVKAQLNDYILVLGPIRTLRYDPQAKVLRGAQGEGRAIAVDPVYNTSMGTLFRVRGVDVDS